MGSGKGQEFLARGLQEKIAAQFVFGDHGVDGVC